MKPVDISGKTFGFLTVDLLSENRNTKGQRLWKCVCECGNIHHATGSHLRLGDVTSCGCKASRLTLGIRKREEILSLGAAHYLEKNSEKIANGCSIWNGATTQNGYGAAHFYGKYQSAHRLSYQTFIGEIPDGMFICHSCDTPACINPKHLFLGTHQDNMTDKVSKSRHSHGEVHGMHKLFNNQVIQILDKKNSVVDLSKEFGVSVDHVYAIRAKKAWRHLHGINHAT